MKKQTIRIKQNAQKHALAMKRTMGQHKALEVAQKCLQAALKTSEGLLLTTKEIKKTRGFWSDVVGILSK